MFNWASRHKDFQKDVFVRGARQHHALLRSKATPEAKKLHNWNRQVGMGYCKTISFLRLKTSKKGILYGEINPEHRIEDLVTRHFMKRFPTYMILIGSSRGTFLAVRNSYRGHVDQPLKQFLHQLESYLSDDHILADLDFDESWWETYYDSQEIPERENKRLFLQFMPKKYHYMTDHERKQLSKIRRLDSF